MYFINSLWESILLKQLAAGFFKAVSTDSYDSKINLLLYSYKSTV